MDPVSAVGLAASIAQFVHLASNVLRTTVHLNRDPQFAPETLRDAEHAAQAARWHIQRLPRPLASPLTQSEPLVQDIRTECTQTADQLVSLFHKIRTKDGTPSHWSQIKTATKTAFKEKEIIRLRNRLDRHLQQLNELNTAGTKDELATQGDRLGEVHTAIRRIDQLVVETEYRREADNKSQQNAFAKLEELIMALMHDRSSSQPLTRMETLPVKSSKSASWVKQGSCRCNSYGISHPSRVGQRKNL